MTDDERLIVETAKARPERVGVPFTHWSKRELRDHLADNRVRKVEVSKERLRQVLDVNGVTVQRAKPGRCPTNPGKETRLDRIEEVIMSLPDRTFALDELGPLAVHPAAHLLDPARWPAAPRRRLAGQHPAPSGPQGGSAAATGP